MCGMCGFGISNFDKHSVVKWEPGSLGRLTKQSAFDEEEEEDEDEEEKFISVWNEKPVESV